jgi:hypothetical protein
MNLEVLPHRVYQNELSCLQFTIALSFCTPLECSSVPSVRSLSVY